MITEIVQNTVHTNTIMSAVRDNDRQQMAVSAAQSREMEIIFS